MDAVGVDIASFLGFALARIAEVAQTRIRLDIGMGEVGEELNRKITKFLRRIVDANRRIGTGGDVLRAGAARRGRAIGLSNRQVDVDVSRRLDVLGSVPLNDGTVPGER